MNIYPLGTSGFIPTETRETSSYLVVIDRTAILLDAGTGIKRLAQIGQNVLANVERINVLFSHMHHDHTAGLTWLLKLAKKPIRFYLPTNPLVDYDGLSIIRQLTSPPVFALPLEDWPNFSGVELISNRSGKLVIEGVEVNYIKQYHDSGSVGYRIGQFSYITDTDPDNAHIDFISDCSLVVMDTMYDREEKERINISGDGRADHGWSIGNASIARKANVKKLALAHLNPGYDNKRLLGLLEEAKEVFEDTVILDEGNCYSA